MDQVILYIHGQGGTPREAERFRPLCPGYDVIGAGYQGSLPWQVRGQLLDAYGEARRQYRRCRSLPTASAAILPWTPSGRAPLPGLTSSRRCWIWSS